MSNIVGLGEMGSAVANEFKKYPPYTVYNIAVGDKRTYGKKTYIKEQKTAEKYEEKCPSLKNFLKNVKGDVLFIVDGAELVSATSLRILSHIKKCNITVLYIKFTFPVSAPLLNSILSVTNTGSVVLNDISPNTCEYLNPAFHTKCSLTSFLYEP